MTAHRLLRASFALFTFCFAAFAHAATPNDLAGDWSTGGDAGVVRLHPCAENAGALCGTLVSSRNPSRLRHGGLGMVFLRNFLWDGETFRGVINSPDDGRTYRGIIRPGARELNFQGCLGPFCQTEIWRRVG
ncbi:MAG: DUF2147 domain-containing protein [Hyphomonadaceae bacterium]|nr:DUF2147 domain-containing protein [Hyphomonadaceae bacterium]